MNEEITNIRLNELMEIENLSIRSYNICLYSDLLMLKDILTFQNMHGDFKKLRNCGKISNQELIDVCNKYKHNKIKSVSTIIGNTIRNISLKELVMVEKLSVWVYHVCQKNYLLDLKRILLYYRKNGDFMQLQNSTKELNRLFD